MKMRRIRIKDEGENNELCEQSKDEFLEYSHTQSRHCGTPDLRTTEAAAIVL
jgi:hypothetical protein